MSGIKEKTLLVKLLKKTIFTVPYITDLPCALAKKQINRLLLFLTAITFWQCAGTGKPGLLGRLYHNTTAQYNAYYLGSERLTDAEIKLTAATPNDYTRVLPLFPSTDTTITSTLRPQFEEVIKKASFAIKKHPQSR